MQRGVKGGGDGKGGGGGGGDSSSMLHALLHGSLMDVSARAGVDAGMGWGGAEQAAGHVSQHMDTGMCTFGM